MFDDLLTLETGFTEEDIEAAPDAAPATNEIFMHEDLDEVFSG